MGPEGCVSSKGPGVGATFVHKRSKSFPDKRKNGEDNLDGFLEASDHSKLDTGYFKDSVKTKKKQSPRSTIQTSLKQEILQLEKKLQDQVIVRRALEKALGDGSSSRDFINEASLPKHASDLIQEIAVLELEVVHLEQYLLSLYRKTFDQQISLSPSVKDVGLKSPLIAPRKRFLEASRSEASCLSLANPWNESSSIGEEKLLDSTVQRCHSSLSQRTFRSNRTSPPTESLAKLLRACHSQPLSMLEYASPNVISLADHLGTPIRDHVPETPNKLSEDMIKCISSIYCKLSDPPLTNHYVSSPNSSLSSLSAFSPKDQCDIWSPGLRKDSSFDVRLDNPFHVEGLKEFSGPYSTMVEVSRIHRDTQKLGDIEDMLQCFRSLIGQLEGIDPRKMKHEEKLAFWINVHNALVMHAYLAYGIPQSNAKRVFLLLKAAYNIGGHIVSADTIQDPILGCRMSRPGQWLRFLLPSRTKFKAGDERQEFAVKHAEPLLHFALCSGSHSDPAVRVYTPKSVIQELEIAKEEYIRATFGVRKDKKILIPKIVESFAKDSGLPPAGVREVIEKCLPESVKRNVSKCQSAKSGKSIEWVPYNFAFRYLISKELVK